MADVHIGARIRDLRETQNYTREALAEKIDVSAKFLYEIETGKKGFSADTLVRISQALSVSCDYIMLGEDVEHHNAEKVICVLEMLHPHQVSRMQELLKLLAEMCDTI